MTQREPCTTHPDRGAMASSAYCRECWDLERKHDQEYARLRAGLVELYREVPVAVARVCDEVIDRSGRLLGEIRNEARSV